MHFNPDSLLRTSIIIIATLHYLLRDYQLMNINHISTKTVLIATSVILFAQVQTFAEETDIDEESTTTYVSTDNFDTKVLQSEIPVLVDFTATWCVPCREVDPIIDELAVEMEGKVKVFKLDIDDSPEIYREYRVNGIPHILFFRDGVEEDRIGGAQAKSIYVQYLDGMLAGKSAHDITIEMLDGDSFRRYFILYRDLSVVESALETVPDLLTQEFENGQTPLSLILNRSSVRQDELITLALSFDPDISTHDLVGLGRCEEFLEAIKEDPEALNRHDPDGNSVLLSAMMRSYRLGEKDCTDVVLSAGVNLDKQKSANNSLGRALILKQDVEVLEKFIELGWDVDSQDEQGYSTLQWAAYYGYIDSVLYLLQHGADPTLKYSDDKTIVDYVKRSLTRATDSLEEMQSDEERDFTEQIKIVQSSIEKHQQVLALLEEQIETDLTSAESDSAM